MATLKDIAALCGVTPTVVSAVLNHRKGTICCSEKKRRQIEKTAAELQYHVNIMARSIVQQRIPIVALMFHRKQVRAQFMDRYFSSTASELNFQLLQHNLESLLAFYRSEEEQIERFQSLMQTGLIGGVISNLIPEKNAGFIRVLQASGVPYVLLGTPQIPAVALRVGHGIPWGPVQKLLRHVHAENCYLHRMFDGEHLLALHRKGRPPEWNIPVSPDLTEDPDNLILSYGAEFYWKLRQCMTVAKPAIVEERGFEYLIPQGVPCLFAVRAPSEGRPAKAAAMLTDWMKRGIVPPPQVITMPTRRGFQLFLQPHDKNRCE
ncbi:MAG: LacI family DNA-binding transcriptional regulator [Lentisphaeria bacterium]|nr:LacI family DNA-binding transcriptional regulator [Lentisphaeria bacterium]